MDDAVGILKNSIAVFETASQRLLDFYSYDKEIHLGIQKFIHACQCACTANLNWRSVNAIYRSSTIANLSLQSYLGAIQAG